MIKGKWYKFKKTWRNGGHTDSYKFLSEDECGDWTDADVGEHKCLPWAERVGGGHNYGFEYEWKEIKYPPQMWLKNEISFSKKNIRDINYNINFISEVIEYIKKEKLNLT